jgi:hypothetical protein
MNKRLGISERGARKILKIYFVLVGIVLITAVIGSVFWK